MFAQYLGMTLMLSLTKVWQLANIIMTKLGPRAKQYWANMMLPGTGIGF